MLDLKQFHKSTSDELIAIKDRVRSLIGDRHWGEEGRYKEAVLKTVINRFLPKNFDIGSGFIIKKGISEENSLISSQIDIIIYDNNFPVVFREGNLVIVSAESVRGIIEVKTNLENQNLKNVFDKCNKIGKEIYEAKVNNTSQFFNGIFSYEGYESHVDSAIETIARNNLLIAEDVIGGGLPVNHISLNKDLFIKRWDINQSSLYRIKDLSFSFFISNLLECLSHKNIRPDSQLWFPEDKANFKICDL